MTTDNLTITAMTTEYARQISHWKYDGEYSLYDENEENADEFMDGTHYICLSENDELVGYFCFGKDAQIPTVEKNVYEGDYLDIGLGLKPDLCGRKLGLSFFHKGLDFAFETFGTTSFRLSVAAFNERAIKVYERAGFYVKREVTHSASMNKFIVMDCKR